MQQYVPVSFIDAVLFTLRGVQCGSQGAVPEYRIKQSPAVTLAGAERKRQEMGAKCDQNSNFGHLGKL
jgi:hypothetical protein